MRLVFPAVFVVLFLQGAAIADVSITPILTIKDAQADYTAGNYPACLQKIATMVPVAAVADKPALFALKGECLIAQKQATAASEAFLAASSAYTTAKDKKNAAVTRATADVIRNSTDFNYTPKTGKDKNPLTINDPAQRPAALTAFYNDQAAATLEAKKALGAGNTPPRPSLPDIQAFAPKLQTLEIYEMAATGDDAKTLAMQKALATQAKNEIAAFVNSSNTKVDTIAAAAATKVPIPGTGGKGGKNKAATPQQTKEKGLTEPERNSLNDLLATADKIPPAAKSLVPALNTDADFFNSEIASTSALKKKIDALLAEKFH
jgi:hypothetical protein